MWITAGLSSSFTLMKARALCARRAAGSRSAIPLASMALPKARANVLGDPHDFARSNASPGPRIVSAPGNFANGKTLSLTLVWRGTGRFDDPELVERLADHDHGRDLRERSARRLRDERHRAARARVHFEDVDLAALDRELHVHQPDDAELEREHARLLFDREHDLAATASAAGARSTSRRSGFPPLRCAA